MPLGSQYTCTAMSKQEVSVRPLFSLNCAAWGKGRERYARHQFGSTVGSRQRCCAGLHWLVVDNLPHLKEFLISTFLLGLCLKLPLDIPMLQSPHVGNVSQLATCLTTRILLPLFVVCVPPAPHQPVLLHIRHRFLKENQNARCNYLDPGSR